MSKILKNQTASAILLGDVGVTIPASPATYTIQSTDDLSFAGSSDLVTHVGSGDIIVNDGTQDLTSSDGLDLVKGLFPKEIETIAIETAASRDAFGRLRTSMPRTIFASDNRYDILDSIRWDTDTTGAASLVHSANKSSEIISTTTASGDKLIHQTRRYIEYTKGKSQTIFLTGNFKEAVANVSKKYGLFDDLNGYFFYTLGTEFGVCIRSSVSGSIVDTKVAQSSWNKDKLDGTGASGYTLDISKQQFLTIDFGWLGIADVRFFIMINGELILIHTFTHSNVIDVSYSQAGTLPIRIEIENTAASAGSTIEVTCQSVQSESLPDLQGPVYIGDSGTSETSVGTSPVILNGLRLNPSTNRASIKPVDFRILGTSGNSTLHFRVLLNPTIVGGTWANNAAGLAQGLTGYTSFSGGAVLDSGYIQIGGETLVSEFISDIYLGRSINGTSDVLVLAIETLSSNSKALFSGKWREYT